MQAQCSPVPRFDTPQWMYRKFPTVSSLEALRGYPPGVTYPYLEDYVVLPTRAGARVGVNQPHF